MAPSSKPWADGPFELLSARGITGSERGKEAQGTAWAAESMLIVHNLIIRMMNSVYLQCVNVGTRGTDKDQADFVAYALAWSTFVDEHHHNEEAGFFDEIERLAGAPGIMQANVDQHRMFHTGVEEYETYLKSVQAGAEKYDGAKLRAIIDNFMPTLTEHLTGEIETLKGLAKYEDKCEWGVCLKVIADKILAEVARSPSFMTVDTPLMICIHDKTFEGYVFDRWPPMPWYAGLIVRLWYFRTYRNMWRFAPCTAWGNPQELPFADDKPHQG